MNTAPAHKLENIVQQIKQGDKVMKNQFASYRFYLTLCLGIFFFFSNIKIKADEIKNVKHNFLITTNNKAVPVGGIESIVGKIRYPKLAQRLGIEGKVCLRAIVNENGEVNEIRILNGLGGGCDDEVVTALSGAKFLPAVVNGSKVKSEYDLTVSFKLYSCSN